MKIEDNPTINNVTQVVHLNEIPPTVDPRNATFKKIVIISTLIYTILFAAMFVVSIVLDWVNLSDMSETWWIVYDIAFFMLKIITIAFICIVIALLTKLKMPHTKSAIICLSFTIVLVLGVAILPMIANYGIVIDGISQNEMWVSAMSAIETITLLFVVASSLLVSTLFRTTRPTKAPEPTHERIL